MSRQEKRIARLLVFWGKGKAWQAWGRKKSAWI
jgi:hypothetical protein